MYCATICITNTFLKFWNHPELMPMKKRFVPRLKPGDQAERIYPSFTLKLEEPWWPKAGFMITLIVELKTNPDVSEPSAGISKPQPGIIAQIDPTQIMALPAILWIMKTILRMHKLIMHSNLFKR